MQDSRIHLPSGAGLEPVGAGMKQHSIVALVPIFETTPDVVLGGTGFKTHEGVGEIIFSEVVLRRKIVSFGLAALTHQLGLSIALMHVMRDWAHVVEKLAKEIPSAFALHHAGAEQEVSGGFNRVL